MIAKKQSKIPIGSNTQDIIPSKSLHPALIVGLVVLVMIVGAVLAAGQYLYEQRVSLADRIYPGVRIENVDVGALTPSAAQEKLRNHGFDPSTSSITIKFRDEKLATFSAQKLGLKLNVDTAVEEAFMYGRRGSWVKSATDMAGVILGKKEVTIPLLLTYNTNIIKEYVATLATEHDVEAQNALFSFENGRVSAFTIEKNGSRINQEKVMSSVEKEIQTLKDRPRAISVVATEEVLKPTVTLAQSNNLGIEELIGVGKSDYTHSAPERVHNVIHAANRFNGVLVKPGQELSFVDIIGDISQASGYKTAYVIQNGRTVLGDGGGVCQVSTTLFRAALNTGLPITERHAHAYRVGYYENDSKPGLDATIYTPSVDLRIKNDTPAHILVQTIIDEDTNQLYFYLYGKKDGRQATVGDITVYDVSPPPEPLYQDDPNLPIGITKQVDFAAWGGKSRYDYSVTYANGDVKKETFYSSYRPWQAVFLVGKKG